MEFTSWLYSANLLHSGLRIWTNPSHIMSWTRAGEVWCVFNEYLKKCCRFTAYILLNRKLSHQKTLALNILLFTTTPTFANSVDSDQKPSDQDLHYLSFSLWIWTKTYDVIWLADSQKWVWLIKLFSRIRVRGCYTLSRFSGVWTWGTTSMTYCLLFSVLSKSPTEN